MKETLLVGLKRFVKGFIAGGVAQAVLIMQAGLTFHDVTELRNVGWMLLAGFITGGLLALEKMLMYEPSPTQSQE